MKIVRARVLIIFIVSNTVSVVQCQSSNNVFDLGHYSFSRGVSSTPLRKVLFDEKNINPGTLPSVVMPHLLKSGSFSHPIDKTNHRSLAHKLNDIHDVDPSQSQSQIPLSTNYDRFPANNRFDQIDPSAFAGQEELNPFDPPFSPSPQDVSSDLFTLPLATADLKPIAESIAEDPFNRFLTAPTAPFNVEGSEIGEAAFIVPDDIAFAPAPPAFVQPRKTYGLTINDGKVYRNEVRKDNGEFISSYRSADGTKRSEMGRLIKTPNGGQVLVFKGSYSFTTPEGLSFQVDYTADRNGYRATTTPIKNRPRKPRPPPRPPKHRPHKG